MTLKLFKTVFSFSFISEFMLEGDEMVGWGLALSHGGEREKN